MRIQIVCQVQQVGLLPQFRVENGIIVSAEVVRNVAVQYVGQDESRGTIACICQLLYLLCAGASHWRTNDHRVDALWERASHGLRLQKSAMRKNKISFATNRAGERGRK